MTEARENPMFGKFDEVMKGVLRVPSPQGLGSFWGRKQTLKFVDMFCGVGGFHAAAESEGGGGGGQVGGSGG
jgi:hypothetical protein